MRLSELRKSMKALLSNANIEVRDADIIIAQILNKNITELFVDFVLSNGDVEKITEAINKRLIGMPITKIFNKAYFYGLEFYINNDVLSPRPETELLVDNAVNTIKAKMQTKNQRLRVLDMCTGSGAIACAIKSKCDVDVVAVDVSELALNVAKKNAKSFNQDICFIKSNMFDNVNGTFDIIVSNPPYIETETCSHLDKEVKDYDPIIALDGGNDGLDFYKILINNCDKLNADGYLIVEIGYNQGESVKALFKKKFKNVEIIKDYNSQNRIVVAKN